MKRIVLAVVLLSAALCLMPVCRANVAQPGIWQAGGGGFNFLYPQDSAAFRQIRMESEAVAIQLYAGFAVVKGTYRMRNTSPDPITIRVGYPVAGIYEGNTNYRTEIVFRALNALRVRQDGQPISILEAPVREVTPGADTFQNNNWYVWESTFLPGHTSEIEVYFMVNTNDAEILEGYARDYHNAFIYILESGSLWQQPIGRAEFRVQLMDDLEITAIHGISLSIDFGYDPANRLLFGFRTDFTPMPADNLLINYGRRLKDLDYGARVGQSQTFYHRIDQLAALSPGPAQLQPYEEKNPFYVRQTRTIGWIFGIIFIGVPVLVVAAAGYFLYRMLNR